MAIYLTAVEESEMLDILNAKNEQINRGLKYEPLQIIPQETTYKSIEYLRFMLTVFPAMRVGADNEESREAIQESQRYWSSSDRRRAALMKAIEAASAITEELNDYNYTLAREPKKYNGPSGSKGPRAK